jgi:hypothetical protein
MKGFLSGVVATGWLAYELVQPNPDGTFLLEDANEYEDA